MRKALRLRVASLCSISGPYDILFPEKATVTPFETVAQPQSSKSPKACKHYPWNDSPKTTRRQGLNRDGKHVLNTMRSINRSLMPFPSPPISTVTIVIH